MPAPVVLNVPPALAEAVRAHLVRGGFEFEDRPHAFFLARRPGVTVTYYRSGKLLVTGAQADEYGGVLRATFGGAPHADDGRRTTGDGRRDDGTTDDGRRDEGRQGEGDLRGGRVEPAGAARTVGSDETGKGDYFGPLVVAAVYVPDEATARALVAKGVRDSKRVPDAEARLLGSLVAAKCPHHVLALAPRKYNELHAKTGNLNVLLAWAHARALERVVADAQAGVDRVVVDRFARGPRLTQALPASVRALPLVEEPRAEARYVAVAAASLLARAEFLRALSAMEAEWAQPFPKSGGGRGVENAARRFVRAHGKDALGEVAKLHFATTGRVT